MTPNKRSSKMSPLVNRHFGSTDKSRSKSKRHATPTKSYNGGYSPLFGNSMQVYKNSKKEGL